LQQRDFNNYHHHPIFAGAMILCGDELLDFMLFHFEFCRHVFEVPFGLVGF
jgi:hypothetical protein